MRRVAFSIAAAVVACMGAWILLTSLADGGDSGVLLSAVGTVAEPGFVNTVVLRVISPEQLDGMRQLIETDAIRNLAGENEFHFLELDDGSIAVCVGRFKDPDSPRIMELLRSFRDMATESGARPFGAARIVRYRE